MKRCYCFLERFNNYFNRKIIKYESVSDYESHAKDSFIPYNQDGSMTHFDFNPNDNVTTEIIANDVPFDPDYFLLLDSDGNIVQRWFILEQKRNRQGQWLYDLKRDVIADNLENLWNAPIFVEKGMLNESDPFIVNSEGMSLNQIKKSETFLKDKSETAWIVGYMARNIGGSDINIQVDEESMVINYKTLAEIASYVGTDESTLTSLINFDGLVSITSYFTDSIRMHYWLFNDFSGPIDRYAPCHFNFNSEFTDGTYRDDADSWFVQHCLLAADRELTLDEESKTAHYFRDAVITNKNTWVNNIASIFNRTYYFTNNQLAKIKSFNGVYVKYNGEYYRFLVNERGYKNTLEEDVPNYDICVSATVSTTIATAAANGINLVSNVGEVLKELEITDKEVIISMELMTDSPTVPQVSTKISSSRKITSDQEYDIFAIPLNINYFNGVQPLPVVEEYSRKIAAAIALEEDAKVYDLQLLPYCPLPSLLSNNNEIDISNLTEDEDFNYIKKNTSATTNQQASADDFTFTDQGGGVYEGTGSKYLSAMPLGKTAVIDSIEVYDVATGATVTDVSYTIAGNIVNITLNYNSDTAPDSSSFKMNIYYHWNSDVVVGLIFYVPFATFTTIINQQININKSKKVLSNCYMHRIVSPNYQGSFEFNIAKNGGKVSSFNVFCTYKPYTPIIKVAPNFEWLYGLEYQDNRGLLCGGDFSLPRVSDAWVNYQLNNKNYQNIFNRDIQHLDFMQSIEMRNQLVSGAVGIVSDAAKGAAAGAMVGGGWGAVGGAVLGGATSAIGYGIDIDTMARTHRENRQLAIDKFNYKLGNVKALPYTLTKVGSFDAISKIFPFIEEYSCSDEELRAFENKIKYESMTVMRIGTLNEFANFNSELNYFKGSLIRNDEIADDPHILNAIYEEFLKGVYI